MSSKQHKQKKAAKKQAKAAASSVLGDRVCPCCKKHCPLVKPKCGKGKAVRAKALEKSDTGKKPGKPASKRTS